MTKRNVLAVDLAKDVFEVLVSERPGRVMLRKRLSRQTLASFLEQLPPVGPTRSMQHGPF